jgi:hypothetical protein
MAFDLARASYLRGRCAGLLSKTKWPWVQLLRRRSSAPAAEEKTFDKILVANRGEIACRVCVENAYVTEA